VIVLAWLLFFILMWLIVIGALYTWYYSVKIEKTIRKLEKGSGE